MDGLAATFDRDAAGYAAGRPGYPQALFDLLAERCGLRPGAQVIEIGPGTGQATAELLRRGAVVTAVEPGRNLAKHLVETLGSERLTVVTKTFEDARLEPASADLVVSATAFHWVDPMVGLEKVRAILRPGGCVALWWNVFHAPDEEADAFSETIDPIFSAFQDAEESHSTAKALDADTWLGRLRAGFVEPTVDRLSWEAEHDSNDLVALFATYSNVRSLPDADRERFLEAIRDVADHRFNGRVTRSYVTVLYTGSKPDREPAPR